MRRRKFIALLGGATVAWPLVARAQQAAQRPLIAFLFGSSPLISSRLLTAFSPRMQALGYVEGRDYDVASRFAEGDLTRLPELASELIRLRPDIIVTGNTTAAVAAKKATSIIPIVSAAMIEPVEKGLVASHARPGANLTGILVSLDTLLGKQLELGIELVPGAKKVGAPINVTSVVSAIQQRDAERVAAALRVQLMAIEVRAKDEIEKALRTLANEGVQVAVVHADPMFSQERRRIAAVSEALKLPVIYGFREHVEDGGLMSYGIDLRANWRRAADFVDKILKGTKAADLPVELPSKLELVINLKTARALGLDVPPMLLVRADEVIE
jgi:putative tryptophan/tyrosine transport system substrate-binding protein